LDRDSPGRIDGFSGDGGGAAVERVVTDASETSLFAFSTGSEPGWQPAMVVTRPVNTITIKWE